MRHLIALFACLLRLIRPSQAVHADPYGRCAGVLAELRRNRARRVRRYVISPGSAISPPVIPAPREPVDSLPRPMPWIDPLMVDPRYPLPPASMVRGYYVHHVRTQTAATGVAA